MGQSAPTMRRTLVVALCVSITAGACTWFGSDNGKPDDNPTARPESGIHKIEHVVIIMQENRSFDNYFATYPGAEGIASVPQLCAPDPKTNLCVRPYHDSDQI